MDEIESRLAAMELLVEVLFSVLGADQVDELRRRLATVDGLDADDRAIVAQARRVAGLAEQVTAPPATGAAQAAALLDDLLRTRFR